MCADACRVQKRASPDVGAWSHTGFSARVASALNLGATLEGPVYLSFQQTDSFKQLKVQMARLLRLSRVAQGSCTVAASCSSCRWELPSADEPSKPALPPFALLSHHWSGALSTSHRLSRRAVHKLFASMITVCGSSVIATEVRQMPASFSGWAAPNVFHCHSLGEENK